MTHSLTDVTLRLIVLVNALCLKKVSHKTKVQPELLWPAVMAHRLIV